MKIGFTDEGTVVLELVTDEYGLLLKVLREYTGPHQNEVLNMLAILSS